MVTEQPFPNSQLMSNCLAKIYFNLKLLPNFSYSYLEQILQGYHVGQTKSQILVNS